MEKHIYLIRGEAGESYGEFHRRMMDTGKLLIDTCSPQALKITLTRERPPRISVIPFSRKKIAVISVVSELSESPGMIPECPGFAGAFRATEAIPVGYEKSWQDGQETPGACLLTLFRKKKSIDYETFIRRWHQGHTPLSLKLHPLWNYNRNVVTGRLTEQPFWFDAVVEEQVRSRRELLNIFRFFGKPHKLILNMWLVLSDTRSFIDYPSTETYLAAEYHLKS